MNRPIKVLIAKPGLDGHDRGAKVIANALRDAGMEVVYTGLHQTPEMIVEAAVQEDVDLVSVSILSGAHMTLIPRIRQLMNGGGLGAVPLVAGGIIPDADAAELKKLPGVAGIFGPGTSTRDVIAFIAGLFPGRAAK
jgi:methylmalonyl-CoA mutase C-terminal domain/subunit